MPNLGQPYYRASQPVVPEQVEFVVVAVQPDQAGSVVAPVEGNTSSEIQAQAQDQPFGSELRWVQSFQPRTEFSLDFGVGEAPYDDSDHDLELDFRPVHGFSDALVQLEWRSQVAPGFSWHSIAAMNRVQEDTLMEMMDAGDWAWVGLGVQWSW